MARYWWLDLSDRTPATRPEAIRELLKALQRRMKAQYPAPEGYAHSLGWRLNTATEDGTPRAEFQLEVQRGASWGLRLHLASLGDSPSRLRRLKVVAQEGTRLIGTAVGALGLLVVLAGIVAAVAAMVNAGKFSLRGGWMVFLIAAAGACGVGAALMVPLHFLMNLRMRSDVAQLGEVLEGTLSSEPIQGVALQRRIDPVLTHGAWTLGLAGVLWAAYAYTMHSQSDGVLCGMTLVMIFAGLVGVYQLVMTVAGVAGFLEGPGVFGGDFVGAGTAGSGELPDGAEDVGDTADLAAAFLDGLDLSSLLS